MLYIAPSLQQNFGYQLPDNMPFDYHCNAYGNNNSTNHNHNNSIHVNNTVATGIGKPSFPSSFLRIHNNMRMKKFSSLLQFLCCSEVEKHLMLEMSFFFSVVPVYFVEVEIGKWMRCYWKFVVFEFWKFFIHSRPFLLPHNFFFPFVVVC